VVVGIEFLVLVVTGGFGEVVASGKELELLLFKRVTVLDGSTEEIFI